MHSSFTASISEIRKASRMSVCCYKQKSRKHYYGKLRSFCDTKQRKGDFGGDYQKQPNPAQAIMIHALSEILK